MKLVVRATNLGIEFSLHEGEGPRNLEPASDADQQNPRRHYVYAHVDSCGNVFYVGKGSDRRAWSTDRHSIWWRYVDKHLSGQYEVRILQDNLSEDDAEHLEAEWIAQCSDGLVNWGNMGRAFDLDALDRFHKLQNANRTLIAEARGVEKLDAERAVGMYMRAVEAIRTYAFLRLEEGLVGQLLEEEDAEFGKTGEIEALDRLTLCLIKLGRHQEASRYADSYFALYRRDMGLAASDRIKRRIEKALARAQE
jgi:hypothetical protein